MSNQPVSISRSAHQSSIGIGILGVARIAEAGIIVPARATGSLLASIGARTQARAQAFADKHGVTHATDSYLDVIEDPDVHLVYNPLPNSLHAEWNLRAIAAGKHVLSEKPFARNADEARSVHAAGIEAGLVVADGFHYRYHPAFLRLVELVRDGEIGEVRQVRVNFIVPRPTAGDIRLSPELAGGALMDAGCYALHAVNLISTLTVGEPNLASAVGHAFSDLPTIDEEVTATFDLPGGGVGTAHTWMGGDHLDLSIEVVGSHGTARMPNFISPHHDDRVQLLDQTGTVLREERLGSETSYTYQLRAVLRSIRSGAPLPTDSADAIRTMTLVDECYRLIGMQPR